MTLSERDENLIWHPFANTTIPPIPIKRAQGCFVYDDKDKPYLDLISSWWVNLHGHSHPDIARAIYDQALTLEHVIFSGFTHEPAVQLCEKLKTVLPNELNRFFFSDNGSTSVEVALKMAYQYWILKENKEKTLFISFEGGYHGDTFGAMSVGAHSGFHDHFKKLMFQVLSLPFPHTWQEDNDVEVKEEEALKALDNLLYHHGQNIAAIILEPIVQGAAGMRMCSPSFIKKLIEKVRHYNILVIFDEIMTGFYRTGTLFALEQINITPDFLCLSKGITGGFLPLAVTVTTNMIYQAFNAPQQNYLFAHGHSYTANPIACAAAIASFDLCMHDQTKQAVAMIQKTHEAGLNYLKEKCPFINKPRAQGTISAFDVILTGQRDMKHLNLHLKKKFLEKGLLLRPLGATVYLLPPYVIQEKDLQNAYEHISDVLMGI